VIYLKHYTHLFVEDGREGEVVPTFHISKTTYQDYTSDSIPISQPGATRSSTRSRHVAPIHRETLS
jgi:hypothetical protein